MVQRTTGGETVPRGHRCWRRGRGRPWLTATAAGALAGAILAAAPAPAQTRAAVPPPPPGRLTVRPHEMATGTRTVQAGWQVIDSLPGSEFYVPPQCVGTRRCPLMLGYMDVELADRYGFVHFTPSDRNCVAGATIESELTLDPGVPFLVRDMTDDACVRLVDAALTQILRHLAIDPDKIAVKGGSNEGAWSLFLGRNNPDVFSGTLAISPANGVTYDGVVPRNPKGRFFFTGGAGPSDIGFLENAINAARIVRHEGTPVKFVLIMTAHMGRVVPAAETALFGRWFTEGWADPTGTARREAALLAAATPGPRLTAKAVSQLAAFWSRFMQEPASIRDTARLATLKEFPVLIGQERMSVLLSDLPALAARYPSVAAALHAAGLTAAQAQAYRLAVICASTTLELQRYAHEMVTNPVIAPVAPTSVLGKNMALLAAQPELLQPLRDGNMWTTP